ncbi:MAG: hypothetical protein JO257_35355 [Deltaproteobacteria bacterium]|nr:hypothetical protein [Deltaproteobacteria bacterium]
MIVIAPLASTVYKFEFVHEAASGIVAGSSASRGDPLLAIARPITPLSSRCVFSERAPEGGMFIE